MENLLSLESTICLMPISATFHTDEIKCKSIQLEGANCPNPYLDLKGPNPRRILKGVQHLVEHLKIISRHSLSFKTWILKSLSYSNSYTELKATLASLTLVLLP